jgi:hypothetical protein
LELLHDEAVLVSDWLDDSADTKGEEEMLEVQLVGEGEYAC